MSAPANVHFCLQISINTHTKTNAGKAAIHSFYCNDNYFNTRQILIPRKRDPQSIHISTDVTDVIELEGAMVVHAVGLPISD